MSALRVGTGPKAPDGVRIYAVGDVHGRLDLLDRLMDLIVGDSAGRDYARTIVVFLGDYVDHGPDSNGVVGRLINIRRQRNLLSGRDPGRPPPGFAPLFLKGNHEDFLLSFLQNPASERIWLQNGGEATLLSYGLVREVVGEVFWRGDPGLIKVSSMFRTLLPDDHLRFYQALELCYRAGDYFFVHAGVKPGVGLARQKPDDMLRIGDEFLNWPHHFGAIIVHGHSPVLAPEELHNRIGIDTGAFWTGKLTAVGLEGSRRWFLST